MKVIGCSEKHFRKARKEYKCKCGKIIRKGQIHFVDYGTGLFGRGFGKLFVAERLCIECAKNKKVANCGGKITKIEEKE